MLNIAAVNGYPGDVMQEETGEVKGSNYIRFTFTNQKGYYKSGSVGKIVYIVKPQTHNGLVLDRDTILGGAEQTEKGEDRQDDYYQTGLWKLKDNVESIWGISKEDIFE